MVLCEVTQGIYSTSCVFKLRVGRATGTYMYAASRYFRIPDGKIRILNGYTYRNHQTV